MNLSLSNRLLACCAFVTPGDRVADVGCDHGYLGIYLLRQGLARSVIASDINKGPLQSAMGNSRKFGVAEQMEFYLCDGVQGIPRDFDTLVCAGVGADTMVSILDAAPWLKDARYRLILQCQSKCPALRRCLSDRGYAIRRETLAKDGKFLYPVMEVVYAPGVPLSAAECFLTPALKSSGSPLLPEYLERMIRNLRLTVDGISRSGGHAPSEYTEAIQTLESFQSPC